MSYFMARSFDHGGYYETRALLAAAVAAFAVWMWRARGERRFAVMFLSGVIFQGVMEWTLALAGLRGAGYTLSLFGHAHSGLPAYVIQGVLEGGPLATIGYAFVWLATRDAGRRSWIAYALALLGVGALGTVVAIAAMGHPVTSLRPMLRWDWVWSGFIAAAIASVALTRGLRGLRILAAFALGVLIYLLVTYEPMQFSGVRQIAVKLGGEAQPASLWAQVWVMAYSQVIEVTGNKLHFFAFPLVFGLLDAPRSAGRERPAVIFLHGWLMEPAIWSSAIAAIAPRNRWAAPWQPAHGPAAAPATAWGMADWTQWLFRQAERTGARRYVLVGHSMGGMLALAAAAERPERIAGLVIVGSTAETWPEEATQQWLGLVEAVRSVWSPELAAQVAPVLLGPTFLSRQPGWVEAWAGELAAWPNRVGMDRITSAVANRPAVAERLAGFKAAALVVHGEDDAAIPFAAGVTLADQLGAELVRLPGVGHCPPLEAPKTFARELAKFVARL